MLQLQSLLCDVCVCVCGRVRKRGKVPVLQLQSLLCDVCVCVCGRVRKRGKVPVLQLQSLLCDVSEKKRQPTMHGPPSRPPNSRKLSSHCLHPITHGRPFS